MDELRVYVDALFARRGDTAENREMKEEIYGNLAARRDDLIAQGVPEAEAVRRQSRTVWLVWGVCFAVCVAAVSAVLFSSNVWFSRPVRIDGPYALGVMAAPYYLALSTVVFPIAVGRFPLLIAQCERGETDEA